MNRISNQQQTAAFYHKPVDLNELRGPQQQFRVTLTVELSPGEYLYFSRHLLHDTAFLTQYRDYMGTEAGGINRCLLVTSPGQSGGILVNAEGYDYARYAAYIEDVSRLDLSDIPFVQFERTPLQKHRSSQER